MEKRATDSGSPGGARSAWVASGDRTPGRGTVVVELTGVTLAEAETRLHLLGEEGAVTLAVPMDDAELQALRHVIALHGHAHDCPGTVDLGDGLLRRSLAALGVRATTLLVRPSRPPALWLRLWHPEGLRHVDLGTLDACALLLRRRMPVEVLVDHEPTPGRR